MRQNILALGHLDDSDNLRERSKQKGERSLPVGEVRVYAQVTEDQRSTIISLELALIGDPYVLDDHLP